MGLSSPLSVQSLASIGSNGPRGVPSSVVCPSSTDCCLSRKESATHTTNTRTMFPLLWRSLHPVRPPHYHFFNPFNSHPSGEDYSLEIDNFKLLDDLQANSLNQNYDLETIFNFRSKRYDDSLSNSPYIFFGLFAGVLSRLQRTCLSRDLCRKILLSIPRGSWIGRF